MNNNIYILKLDLLFNVNEENINDLYDEILNERLSALRAWCSSNSTVGVDDISASGVFDEIVISEYLMTTSIASKQGETP